MVVNYLVSASSNFNLFPNKLQPYSSIYFPQPFMILFDREQKKKAKGVEMAKIEQKISTLDLYLASFLTLCGIHATLEVKDSRVIFNFPSTDELHKLIMNYNSNVNVPVADFVTAIKTLRGQMLTMRGDRK
jgi:hypothetical protein